MGDKKKIIGLSALVVGLSCSWSGWRAAPFRQDRPGLGAAPGRPAPGPDSDRPGNRNPPGPGSAGNGDLEKPGPGIRPGSWPGGQDLGGGRLPGQSGDPLVTLSAVEFQARLNQAQAQLKQAAADYQRFQFLLKEGAASPQEFGSMEARYKTAQAQVAEAATLRAIRWSEPRKPQSWPNAKSRWGTWPSPAKPWCLSIIRTGFRSKARSTTTTGSKLSWGKWPTALCPP